MDIILVTKFDIIFNNIKYAVARFRYVESCTASAWLHTSRKM